ncbi:hypothetical protein NQ315_011011 [Exocentrus adspersus]|uniref:Tyr recombinase domain-containing protein n=1 Tax=Exocentrus adspersus TaxID=1586481 RepID=A0AAV8VJF8_9CUCU|nr:hypothetical protein NQ315_011011 [Exocentrus adspersus]
MEISALGASPAMEDTYPGCRSLMRLSYQQKGVPEPAIDVLISSLFQSTIKQYNCSYKKCMAYCKGIDVFTADANKLIGFLNTQIEKGGNYNTINQHRSALNTLLQITNDSLVSRFMKGVFRIKPVFPRYNETWDPYPVLEYFNSLSPLTSLSLKELTYKLVVLLALTTSQRVQTLTKIKLSNIRKSQGKIEITITDLIKTSRPEKCQPKITLPYFTEKPNLCIASFLEHYINYTKPLRKDHDSLLITIKKPHHPATAQTVSKWIKKGLALGGVDTDTFKAHSTRHASTSAVYRQGLNIESIKRTAGWSERSSIFNKFYNRPVNTDSTFATCLLTSKK